MMISFVIGCIFVCWGGFALFTSIAQSIWNPSVGGAAQILALLGVIVLSFGLVLIFV